MNVLAELPPVRRMFSKAAGERFSTSLPEVSVQPFKVKSRSICSTKVSLPLVSEKVSTPGPPGQGVVAGPAIDRVGAAGTDEGVVPVFAIEGELHALIDDVAGVDVVIAVAGVEARSRGRSHNHPHRWYN